LQARPPIAVRPYRGNMRVVSFHRTPITRPKKKDSPTGEPALLPIARVERAASRAVGPGSVLAQRNAGPVDPVSNLRLRALISRRVFPGPEVLSARRQLLPHR
jgi:hypothetical protein